VTTDAHNCTASESVTISQATAGTINFTSIENNTCYNSCDGAATAEITGGEAPFSFTWSNGNHTEAILNLCAGDYSLAVIDNNNCITTSFVTIDEPDPIGIEFDVTDASSYSSSDGEITAMPSGGTPPYSYLWSPTGHISPTVAGLTPGTYCITITDANNCTANNCDTVNYTNQLSNNNIAQIMVFPNPSKGIFKIQSNEKIQSVEIKDMIGKKIYYNDCNSKHIIVNQSNLPKGIYILYIQHKTGKTIRKINIQY